jgi:hypothetical protein
MFHTHLNDARMSSIGIPIRATTDGFNLEFQKIIDTFQLIYDLDASQCIGSLLRNLRGGSGGAGSNETLVLEHRNRTVHKSIRNLQADNNREFDPYHDAIMTTMFFYRYDGSITEPPCTDITWWVMNQPMLISFDQLNQIRNLLFTHVDGTCRKTSVHNVDQSVTRPIQPLGEDREIQHCKEGDFISDIAKGRNPAKRCRPYY